jgi:uncharacterized protein YdhG (YjbR/CyaY superfamily)
MESKKPGFTSIDQYIAAFPENIQHILEEIRATIKAAAPEAREKISYQMPTFDLKGNLVHFAAHKNHIGFYPTPSGTDAFKKKLPGTRPAKARCNSRWTNPCHSISSPELCKCGSPRISKRRKKKLAKRRSNAEPHHQSSAPKNLNWKRVNNAHMERIFTASPRVSRLR